MIIDTLFFNGDIHTLDSKRPRARSMGVWQGRIIGFDDDLEGIASRNRVDLLGHCIVPGFHDAHMHLQKLAIMLSDVNLGPTSVKSLDALYNAVAAACTAAPEGAWVVGRGFNQYALGGLPTRDALDRVSHGHPVWVEHSSAHIGVTNSIGFARAGLPAPEVVDDPPGGQIVKDHDGHATGLLKETACGLITRALKPYRSDFFISALRHASDHAIALGLTSVTEPGVGTTREKIGGGSSPGDIHWYQQAYEQRAIRLRMTIMPYHTAMSDLGMIEPGHDGHGLTLGVRTGFGDEWLRIGGVKVLTDGAFNTKSAAVTEDYIGSPGERGMLTWDPQDLRRQLVALHRDGWQLAVHAIGDAAVEEAIRTIEEAQRLFPRPDARHRIEHCGLCSDSQADRIAAAGIIPVPQGSFLWANGDDYLRVLGKARADRSWRMRSFLDRGVIIPGSTDGPVTDIDPVASISGMVNRRSQGGRVIGPTERITIPEAVRAYTYGSAYAEHSEGIKGVLREGFLADFVELSDDIFAIGVAHIQDVRVLRTVIGGSTEFLRTR